eukprot:scaffold603246_cov25-Prasinocladus_malaysianus.AAC.1
MLLLQGGLQAQRYSHSSSSSQPSSGGMGDFTSISQPSAVTPTGVTALCETDNDSVTPLGFTFTLSPQTPAATPLPSTAYPQQSTDSDTLSDCSSGPGDLLLISAAAATTTTGRSAVTQRVTVRDKRTVTI